TSSKSHGATSVSVTMAAMAAETGLQASATPVATTESDSGREGRMPLRYDRSWITGSSGYRMFEVPAPTENRNDTRGATSVICFGFFAMSFAATDTIQSMPPADCIM